MSLSRHIAYSFSLHSVIIDSSDWKLSQMAAHISSSQARLLADTTVLKKYNSNASVNQRVVLCICQNINYSWNYFFRLISFTNFNAQFLYSLTICMLHYNPLQSALIRHAVQPFTEIDDTRYYDNTICPPEDGHVNARNMSRIVM